MPWAGSQRLAIPALPDYDDPDAQGFHVLLNNLTPMPVALGWAAGVAGLDRASLEGLYPCRIFPATLTVGGTSASPLILAAALLPEQRTFSYFGLTLGDLDWITMDQFFG